MSCVAEASSPITPITTAGLFLVWPFNNPFPLSYCDHQPRVKELFRVTVVRAI